MAEGKEDSGLNKQDADPNSQGDGGSGNSGDSGSQPPTDAQIAAYLKGDEGSELVRGFVRSESQKLLSKQEKRMDQMQSDLDRYDAKLKEGKTPEIAKQEIASENERVELQSRVEALEKTQGPDNGELLGSQALEKASPLLNDIEDESLRAAVEASVKKQEEFTSDAALRKFVLNETVRLASKPKPDGGSSVLGADGGGEAGKSNPIADIEDPDVLAEMALSGEGRSS